MSCSYDGLLVDQTVFDSFLEVATEISFILDDLDGHKPDDPSEMSVTSFGYLAEAYIFVLIRTQKGPVLPWQ